MATKQSRMKRTLAALLSMTTLVSALSLTSTAVSADESSTDTPAGQSEESTTDSSVSNISITGMEGKYVPIKETIRGFKEIIEGKHDDLPESAFLFVGTIDEIGRAHV